MTAPIRVMIADDHSQIHLGLAVLQDTNTDLVLVAHASNGQEAVELCEESQLDVIIMDVVMPMMDGVEATRIIHEHYPEIKILALSSFQDEESIHEMMRAGAVGYVLKNSSLDELANSIRAVYSGTNVFSSEVARTLIWPHRPDAPKEDFGLSTREVEVLTLMVKGHNNKEIAHHLVISEPTVKFHVGHILAKLQVSGRVEAVAVAVAKHLTP